MVHCSVSLYLQELNYAYGVAPGAGRRFVMESTDGSGNGPVCGWALCSPVTFLFRLEARNT